MSQAHLYVYSTAAIILFTACFLCGCYLRVAFICLESLHTSTTAGWGVMSDTVMTVRCCHAVISAASQSCCQPWEQVVHSDVDHCQKSFAYRCMHHVYYQGGRVGVVATATILRQLLFEGSVYNRHCPQIIAALILKKMWYLFAVVVT